MSSRDVSEILFGGAGDSVTDEFPLAIGACTEDAIGDCFGVGSSASEMAFNGWAAKVLNDGFVELSGGCAADSVADGAGA